MSGRFNKAPLIYMKARISTSTLPKLSGDQLALFQQEMIKFGLTKMVVSEAEEFSFQIKNAEADKQSLAPTSSKVKRHGFFSQDSKELLVLGKESIEFRTSKYTTYKALCDSVEKILSSLCHIIDAFGFITTQELVLTYADLIAPFSGRELSDYFNDGNGVLPLSILKGKNSDIQQLGLIEVNRVVEPSKRIFVSLEQLPTVDGKFIRPIPKSMTEPDPTFFMPLEIQDEWNKITGTHYGLLMTEAAMLLKVPLGELSFSKQCESIHLLTKETFNDLINNEICDVDWEFINK